MKLPRDMNRISTSVGIGGTNVNADAVVTEFKLGSVNLDPVQRLAVGTFRFPPGFADGLLGADVLLAFGLDIDVPGRMLAVYSVHRCTTTRPDWSEPFEAIAGVTPQKDRLMIPFQLDGVSGQAILDTGASATTIGARMANRLGLTEDKMALDRKIVQSGAGSGTVTAHYHWFRELRVGPSTTKGLMLSVLPTDVGFGDALIGEDFLEGRRVWLSFPTRQVFVSKLAHETGPQP